MAAITPDGNANPHPGGVSELTRSAIAAIDPSDQLGDVLALPEHLRDALWRVESAIMEDRDAPAGLVVAGMGGSAIGGRWRGRRSATTPAGRSS